MVKTQILIVDDESAIRTIYKRLFAAIGSSLFNIIETSSAEEATDALIRRQIDLVLLDINMPQIDGQVFFDVIKEYDPRAKVIIASVYPIDEQKRLIPDASGYFDKSQGPIKLMEKVTSILV